MTGPTTTGSIDAKLTVDDSDFKRGMEEAKAEAKEVGALAPNVKVTADVGPALAKLEAVAAAERNLDQAYQRSAISQEKLAKVTEKYGDESVQAASARLTHSKAIAAEEAAESKLTRAKQIGTAEEDKSTESTNRGTQANNRRVSGLQVLLGLSPALLAATAPIAAAAVGLGAAFGVMAVSGVLAVKGIKDEMDHGTVAGNTYSASLGVLKGDLGQLGQTSAVAMLGSFTSAVGDINSRMPFLNQLVGEGATLLGSMGGTALSGVLNGLQQMNPLIQQGGVELGKFVAWLSSFTGTDGFKDFLAYASANLPAVMHLIESLVTTAGQVIKAFAPMGPVVVGALTAISDGLSALPLPVLAGLVTTATTLGPALTIASTAMKIAGTEAAIFGMKANLAVPVVGVLLAALAGLGLMAATAAEGTNTGTTSVENYTQALRDDTNAIGEHVRAQAAKSIVDSGAAEAARTLGITLSDVTSAALGNSDAIERVKTVTDAATAASMGGVAGHRTATAAQIANGDAAKILTGAINGTNGAITDGIQKNKDYDAVLAATKPALEANTTAAEKQAGAYGISVQAYQDATAAQDAAKASTEKQTTAMKLQNDAAGLLKGALDGLNGKALGAAQAQNAFDSSLANMGDHVSATGKKITFTTTSIGDMSAASVALRGDLNGQIANLQGVVEANGGMKNSTGAAKAEMEKMRQQIIDNSVAHGVDRDAVTKYVDNLLTIPKTVPPTKLDIDKAEADAKLAAFNAMVAAATARRTAYIDIITTRIDKSVTDPGGTGSSVGGRENGSLAGGAATGGLIHAGFSASSPAYLSEGGSPFVPRGTDTIPAMLTPGEIVMKRASVDSLGAGNLLHANKTGQWPGQGGGGAAPVINVYVGNEQLDSRMFSVASSALGAANQDAGRRPVR